VGIRAGELPGEIHGWIGVVGPRMCKLERVRTSTSIRLIIMARI
jgi:hypothetical protein